ncbi:MAG: hypothetical protein JWN51_1418 [Phycisphaerales bacterium]|jgi:hypothetical protein|nr:hypothetical protein [Phycisphaerales bacterium]
MEFVLGILVACVLAGVGWPQLVRNRQHYLLAVGCLTVALVFTAFAVLVGGPGAHVLLFFASVADIATFVFLLCAAGGLSLAQLGRDLMAALTNIKNLWK